MAGTPKNFPLRILPKLRAFALAQEWEPDPFAPKGWEVLRLYRVTQDGITLWAIFYKDKAGIGKAPTGVATALLNDFYKKAMEIE